VIYRDALLLVDRKGLVFGLGLDTGSKLWKSSTGRDTDANPILIEGKLIMLTKDNQLLEIDAQSGSARLLFSTRQGETDE
jgi:outer membrane protein assembly factor BamB